MSIVKLIWQRHLMKKLNLHDMYTFGKQLEPISRLDYETKVVTVAAHLWFARARLKRLTDDDSPLLSTSRRAARKLITAIDDVVPQEFSEAVDIDKEKTLSWQSVMIKNATEELESVLGNDMPDIAAYIVSQKGIYRTDDLIAHAERQLTQESQTLLPEQACFDFRQAGKCLAYELATACAFHLWRAVETMMEEYYRALTGKGFEEAGIQLNWGQYIIALNKAGADEKVTVFLDHIRDEYRNPQTHPKEKIDISDSQRLFGVACSSIEQMAGAIRQVGKQKVATALVERGASAA